jgi:hypothetical protein
MPTVGPGLIHLGAMLLSLQGTLNPELFWFDAAFLAGNACGSLLGLTLGANILSNFLN